MKVIMLAAGRSKRMKPIEDKNFLNFLGKPLIQWQLELLHKNGLDDVVVVGGAHNLDKIREIGEGLDMQIDICEQEDLELGMAGAILTCKDRVNGESVLIFSSNDVVDFEAFELIVSASDSDAESYILGKKVAEYFPGGYLEIDENGYIKNIIEKPGAGNEPGDMVNLVLHVHKDFAKLVDYLKSASSERDDRYEVALAAMIKDGVKMKAVPYGGFWQPIKFPWHVHKVFRHFFDKGTSEKLSSTAFSGNFDPHVPDSTLRSKFPSSLVSNSFSEVPKAKKLVAKSADVSKNAVINGDVIIDEGANIFDGAVITGPCYIGRNTIVATNALVRDSNVGADCVVGFSSEVARSYLGNDVWTHSNYIGDSVIGNNVSFGAGTVTGNLRLDEQNVMVDDVDTGSVKFGIIVGDDVRIGVNTSIMPGVKIGSGSFIGAGIVVAQNIPDKSFVRGSWELKISENRESVKGVSRENFKKKL